MVIENQPLKSPHNIRLLRYVLAAIILLFLIQLILYSMEARHSEEQSAAVAELEE